MLPTSVIRKRIWGVLSLVGHEDSKHFQKLEDEQLHQVLFMHKPLVTLVSEFDASLVASGIQDVVVATGLLS